MTKLKKDLPLIVFTSSKDKFKTIFMVFGEFKKKKVKGSKFFYPEFSDLSFFIGKWTVFKTADLRYITRTISRNTPLKVPNADELVRDLCVKYVQGDCITYQFEQLDNDLWKMLDKIKFKSIQVKKHYLPLNILNSRMRLMELCLVTDKYAFYMGDEDEYLAMDVYSHQELNSVTPQFNFDESLDNIATGIEQVFWVRPKHGFAVNFPKNQKKLMSFYLINEKGEEIYHEFYGKFTKDSRISTNWSNRENFSWECPKFEADSLIQIENGFVNENPEYNLELVKKAFSGYTKRSSFYRFVYICDELKELADNITAKKLDINGSKLPEFMLDDDLNMLQLTYADEGFIHYENGRVIDIFDAVGGDQMFEEQFKYEEAQLSGNNSAQHNGEVFYEIDTDARTRLVIARLAYQAKEDADTFTDDEIKEIQMAEAIFDQCFANSSVPDEIQETEHNLPDLPF